MRGLSSVPARAKNKFKESSNLGKFSGGIHPPAPNPKRALNQNHTTLRGNSQSPSSSVNKPNSNALSNASISANESIKPVDHRYFSQILSRDDWSLLLNHELKAQRIVLNSQFVVSLLQNQENPLHPL
ncbi:hypothetical protein SLEP1_g91 [Rubroshorea leprosula]|uniref:Uncharacterized protein n=1 Tax=Rubroshorea leprosula TaxID=152421 RepID=A0AAV5HGE2_9ROSI|nr:hypothetical protein SLEP1_g91 [Rubroshorea leprosula]